MKPFALFCAVLLLTPALAEEPAAPIVNLKAAQAIEFVKKESDAAKADAKKVKLTVLDVRTPEEYSKGHLGDAENINFHDPAFKDKVAKLDKSKPYLVHCASGGRSSKTCDILKALGFKKVYHLDGGMSSWQKAGGPVTPPDAAPAKP